MSGCSIILGVVVVPMGIAEKEQIYQMASLQLFCPLVSGFVSTRPGEEVFENTSFEFLWALR